MKTYLNLNGVNLALDEIEVQYMTYYFKGAAGILAIAIDLALLDSSIGSRAIYNFFKDSCELNSFGVMDQHGVRYGHIGKSDFKLVFGMARSSSYTTASVDIIRSEISDRITDWLK